MMDRMIRKIAAALAAWMVCSTGHCVDGVAVEYGRGDDSTNDVGFAPVFRMEKHRYYVEGAIGLHLVQTRVSADRTFSTSFQFAEHVGAGVRDGRYTYGLQAQHLSNGGIAHPKPGINFLIVKLQYELD